MSKDIREKSDMSEEELRRRLKELSEEPYNKEVLKAWEETEKTLRIVEKYLDEEKPKYMYYTTDSTKYQDEETPKYIHYTIDSTNDEQDRIFLEDME